MFNDWRDRYLALEANEGGGKDLQAAGLAAILNAARVSFLLVHEPGGVMYASCPDFVGPWHAKAEGIRQRIKGEEGRNASPAEICGWFYESRALTLPSVQSFLEENPAAVVISNRCFASSWAIQGKHDSLDLEFLAGKQKTFVGDRVPGLGIYLHVPVAQLQERLETRGKAGQNWQDKLYNLEKINEGYRWFISHRQTLEREYGLKLGDWQTLNGEGSVETVHRRVVEAVTKHLWYTDLAREWEAGIWRKLDQPLEESKIHSFSREIQAEYRRYTENPGGGNSRERL